MKEEANFPRGWEDERWNAIYSAAQDSEEIDVLPFLTGEGNLPSIATWKRFLTEVSVSDSQGRVKLTIEADQTVFDSQENLNLMLSCLSKHLLAQITDEAQKVKDKRTTYEFSVDSEHMLAILRANMEYALDGSAIKTRKSSDYARAFGLWLYMKKQKGVAVEKARQELMKILGPSAPKEVHSLIERDSSSLHRLLKHTSKCVETGVSLPLS